MFIKKDLNLFKSNIVFENIKSILNYKYKNIPILYEHEILLIKDINVYIQFIFKYKFLIISENNILFLNDFYKNYNITPSLYINSIINKKENLNIQLLYLNNEQNILETNFEYNPNIFSNLNENENLSFQVCAPFFGSDITKQKKCIILYKLSKLLYKENEIILYLICFFEVWPCRMVILYFLLYTDYILNKQKIFT